MSNAEFYPADWRASVALNAGWLKQHLPAYLWREDETPHELAHVSIVQTWPSKKRITVLYRLAWQNAAPALQERLYVGYFSAAERLAEEYKALSKKIKVTPAQGRAAVLVPEANLVLLAFPNDRKLRLLSEEGWHAELKAQWRRARKNAGKRLKKWKLKASRVEVLRYVPDKRFTMRCHVLLKKRNGRERKFSFIAKQLTDYRKARRLFNALVDLEKSWTARGQAATAGTAPPVRFPRALGWHQERAMILLEDLPGKNLEQALPEIDLAKTLQTAGEMLALFHTSAKRVHKKITPQSEIKEVRAALRELAAAAPELRPRLRNLLAGLKNNMPHGHEPPVLLHGTFRLNHIFVHDGRLALLDLDSMRMGPPAYDVANFFASLYYFEAEQRITAAQRRGIMQNFSRGYSQQAAHSPAPAAVFWFLASLLINKQAEKYATHFHAGRAEKIAAMLALAENVLAQICHGLPAGLSLSNAWQALP